MKEIKPGEIHIYRINFEAIRLEDDLRNKLQASEISRAEKFRFDDDRLKYIAGRAWLRELISRYLQHNPLDLEIEVNQYGKPYVNGMQNSDTLQFNLSHSGDWIVYAFGLRDELGIDIEKINGSIDHIETAEQFCTVNELCYMKDSENKAELTEKFFRIWTRKEAVLKASGMGLFPNLRRVDVLEDKITITPEQSTWTVTDIHIDKDYKTAIATGGGIKNLIIKQMQV
jgi:4'-phosphopantetheinyl transferase